MLMNNWTVRALQLQCCINLPKDRFNFANMLGNKTRLTSVFFVIVKLCRNVLSRTNIPGVMPKLYHWSYAHIEVIFSIFLYVIIKLDSHVNDRSGWCVILSCAPEKFLKRSIKKGAQLQTIYHRSNYFYQSFTVSMVWVLPISLYTSPVVLFTSGVVKNFLPNLLIGGIISIMWSPVAPSITPLLLPLITATAQSVLICRISITRYNPRIFYYYGWLILNTRSYMTVTIAISIIVVVDAKKKSQTIIKSAEVNLR